MECVYCHYTLPEKGSFCPECANQVKCRHCAEPLLKDAKICVFCGEDITGKKAVVNVNTIEFTETENSRSFKASFTDTVGQGLIDSLGMIFNNRIAAPQPTMTISIPQNINPADPHDLLAETPEPPEEEKHETVVDLYELERLQKVLNLEGPKPVLLELKLKAKSKREYGQRLTLLFLYYKSLLGTDSVSRAELVTLLEDSGVGEGNTRSWLNRNPLIEVFGEDSDNLEIQEPGKDAAKRFLKEIFDDDIPDKWQLAPVDRIMRKPGKSSMPFSTHG